MNEILTPLQVIITATAGWLNRYQANVIDYLIEQNRVQNPRPLLARFGEPQIKNCELKLHLHSFAVPTSSNGGEMTSPEQTYF